MTHTRFGSLGAGGINWDSLPLKLFAGGNAKFWDPTDIDFSQDREDWESLSDGERDIATRLCAEFIAGERGILPGMQQLVQRIGDDERRHMAWGTFTCRRRAAVDLNTRD